MRNSKSSIGKLTKDGVPDAFKLIKTLAKSEKRRFTIRSNEAKEDPQFLKLYEALDRMTEYDDELLDKKMAFVDKWKDFRYQHLNKLFKKILSFLRESANSSGLERSLQKMMVEAELLRQRGLYDACRKRLASAKKCAEELHQVEALIEINRLYRRLFKEHQAGHDLEEMEKLIVEKDRLWKIYRYRMSCQDVYDRISIRSRKYFRMIDQTGEVLKAITGLKDLVDPQSDIDLVQDFESRKLYLMCQAHFFQLTGKIQRENQVYEDLYLLWRAQPQKRLDSQRNNNLVFLNNFLHSCHSLKRYDRFATVLEELQNAPKPISYEEQGELFQCLKFNELLYFLNNHQFAKAVALVPEIEKKMIRFKAKINTARKLAFYYNLFLLFFIEERFADARKYLLKMQPFAGNEVRRDVLTSLPFLQLAVEFEMFKRNYIARTKMEFALQNAKKALGKIDSELTAESADYFRRFVILISEMFDRGEGRSQNAFLAFANEHAQMQTQAIGHPVGLDELQLWTKARSRGVSLRAQLSKQSYTAIWSPQFPGYGANWTSTNHTDL
ncbi:MAG: hypothetical protein AAF998_01690 [Bacteroidota bacterium]